MRNKAVIFILIVFIVFIVGGCGTMSKRQNFSSIEAVNELYELKGTYLGDVSKVRKVVDNANNTDYKVENIELKTDVSPFRLTVNFVVDNRADYRYVDDNGLNRMSGLIFALVPNADEILYRFYDEFSDRNNPDSAFQGSYYTKGNLCERISLYGITPDYIQRSTDTIKVFEDYYETIMATEVAAPDRTFLNKVYEFIGEDCELVVNSGIGADIQLDEYDKSYFTVISEQLPNSIVKYQGAGIKAHLTLNDVRNFKTGEIRQCVFLHYVHPDVGIVMIESSFVDRERYNGILKLIMELQTK